VSKFRYAQSAYLAVLLGVWLVIFAVTRSVLLAAHFASTDIHLSELPALYGVGLFYDVVFLLYASLPLALYLLLCPQRLWRTRFHRWFLLTLAALSFFAMLFTATAEWLFWDEFGVRFNFIAVDYLVYSKEVVDNIMQSYPIIPLLSLLALLAVGLTVALRPLFSRAFAAPLLPKSGAFAAIFVLALVTGAAIFGVGQDFPRASGGNSYARELASNGPYQFFAAFRNNELDYRSLYATMADTEVARLLREQIAPSGARFISQDPLSIRRVVENPGAEKPLNIVLVTVESLSAKYLGSFGDKRGLTPNLDELRQHSLTFTNFYATGTRTDRGLEAVTLSIPPTPGRSIVKRIGRETGYASLGQQLAARGYDSVFLYGGRGYFDNMNAFFSGNGYRIVDQSSVPESEISFKNAWGMADEDLYRQALKVADEDYKVGKPFFFHIMTTSNHRPYSYPDGRIDIASGSGREGAVKYTDYTIGEFVKAAQQKPWFDNTLFVFLADHCAGSAGRQDLPVENYHIPLFIYAPKHVAAREFNGVSSQIDVAPTLLGLLNMDYVSTFFGRDLLRENALPGRALIGNYQHLGLFDGENLAILSPGKGMRRHNGALGASVEVKVDTKDPLIQRDIAWHQGASHAFSHRLLAWQADNLSNEQHAALLHHEAVSLAPIRFPLRTGFAAAGHAALGLV